jgi:helix-turn-helix protein
VIDFLRPTKGGSLRVTFSKGPVLPPKTLVALLAKQRSDWQKMEESSTTNYTSNGYDITLKNVKHGSITQTFQSLAYLQTDFPPLLQNS